MLLWSHPADRHADKMCIVALVSNSCKVMTARRNLGKMNERMNYTPFSLVGPITTARAAVPTPTSAVHSFTAMRVGWGVMR